MAIISSRQTFVHSPEVRENQPLNTFSNAPIRAISAQKSPFSGYMPIAVVKNDLRTNLCGDHIGISGRVFDHSGSKPLRNACIEVWHLSAESEEYKHRARIYTNSNGQYGFITDLPGREMGKNFQIYFKISAGGRNYFAKLNFNHSLFWLVTRHINNHPANQIVKANKLDDRNSDLPFILDINLAG